MNFLDYQHATARTAVYPRNTPVEALSYVALGLAGEAGEIANKVKKILRDSDGKITLGHKNELCAELGDVFWYLSQLATEIGFNLEAVAKRNVDKLADRAARGVLQGSGDNR